MYNVDFPYGKGKISYDFSGESFNGVLVSKLHEYHPTAKGAELVTAAMNSPIGSPRLSELARSKSKVVIIASDHTRPVPSKHIIPFMLAELREGTRDRELCVIGQRVAVYIKNIIPDRMKIKLVLIDAYRGEHAPSGMKYYVDCERVRHMDSWCYSTQAAQKRIETRFEKA